MNALPFLLSWVPVFVWAGLIYFLSSIPHLNSGLGTWDTVLRKFAHIFEYAAFTGLVMRALRRTWPHRSWARHALWAGIIVVLYAMTDEYHQSFIPGRGPSVHDVLVDTVGVVAALRFLQWKRGR